MPLTFLLPLSLPCVVPAQLRRRGGAPHSGRPGGLVHHGHTADDRRAEGRTARQRALSM